jgi:hypothetical protein
MGINIETVKLMKEIQEKKLLKGSSVLELGLQELTIPASKVSKLLKTNQKISNPAQLFEFFGFSEHKSIDGVKASNCYPIDLNKDITRENLEFLKSDLVTNFGTSEHVFNQSAVFKNIHELCNVDGLMVHALPISGHFQHGYFNYHPRLFQELALVNGYCVISMYIASNYRPKLIPYSAKELYNNRFKDMLLLFVFQKSSNSAFVYPYDGVFQEQGKYYGYQDSNNSSSMEKSQFEPFLMSANWNNVNNSLYESSLVRLKKFLSKFRLRNIPRAFQKVLKLFVAKPHSDPGREL